MCTHTCWLYYTVTNYYCSINSTIQYYQGLHQCCMQYQCSVYMFDGQNFHELLPISKVWLNKNKINKFIKLPYSRYYWHTQTHTDTDTHKHIRNTHKTYTHKCTHTNTYRGTHTNTYRDTHRDTETHTHLTDVTTLVIEASSSMFNISIKFLSSGGEKASHYRVQWTHTVVEY